MKSLLVMACATFICGSVFAQQPREKPKGLEAIGQYVGDWTTDVVSKPAEWTPHEIKYRCANHAEMILNGWFLQHIEVSHIIGEPDQVTKTIWFQTFDAASKKYVTWWFSSMGISTHSTGSWDADSQSFTYTDVEPPPGTTHRFVERFRDAATHEGSLAYTGNDGRKMFEVDWTRKRQAGVAGKPLPEQWAAIGKPIQSIPSEVKRLEAFVGQRDAEFINRPSVASPDGKMLKGTMSGQWILDGRWLMGESNVGTVQAKWVIGYDTNRQAYRYVRFTSLGQVEENIGQWNEAEKSFAWKGVGESPGTTKTSTTRLLGEGAVESHIITKNQAGQVQLDLTIKSTPRK